MRRSLLISCLLIVAVSGCGQQAKAPAVIAIVDGQKVLQVDYQQQRKDLIAQARNSGFAGAGLEESDCAEKSAQANKKLSQQKLKQGCGRFLKSLPAQAAAGAIWNKWVRLELAKRKLQVPYQLARKQAQQTIKAYGTKGLKARGLTAQQIINKTTEMAAVQTLKASYAKSLPPLNKQQRQAVNKQGDILLVSSPSDRLQLLVSNNRPAAQQGLQKLQAGASWAEVVKKYSTDPANQASRGLVPYGDAGALGGTNLQQALKDKPAGSIVGPVSFGKLWLVAALIKHNPPRKATGLQRQQGLAAIANQQQAAQASNRMSKELIKYWRPKTFCQPGYKVSLCANGPSLPGAVSKDPRPDKSRTYPCPTGVKSTTARPCKEG